MKNKTLINAGIGIAILVIGFMAYKKFSAKKNEEAKETDAENIVTGKQIGRAHV